MISGRDEGCGEAIGRGACPSRRERVPGTRPEESPGPPRIYTTSANSPGAPANRITRAIGWDGVGWAGAEAYVFRATRLLRLEKDAAPAGGRKTQRPAVAGKGARQRPAKASRILAAKLLRTQGRTIPWGHAAIYAAVVIVVAAALAVWDHVYEARQAAMLAPPPPQVLAKNLVESIVGAGTVRNVSVDQRAGALDVTVEDVLTKPGQSRSEMQKNLTTEGTLAIQIVQSRLRSFKTIAIHLVKAGKPLATVRLGPGQKAPTAEFAAGIQ